MPCRYRAPLAIGLLFVVMGLLIGTAGVWLMALGGSWFYLPAGLGLVLTGLLLLQRSPAALWVHAGLLTATLAWSVWEAGMDWLALVARGDVLFALGLVMVTPWFRRGLEAEPSPAARQGLSAALCAFAAVAVVAWMQGGAPQPQGQPFAHMDGPSAASHPMRAAYAEPTPATALADSAPPSRTLSHPLAAVAAVVAQVEGTQLPPSAAGVRTADLRTMDAEPLALAAPHQPAAGAPLRRLSSADMWGLTMFDQLGCRIAFQRLRFDDRFAPPETPRADKRSAVRVVHGKQPGGGLAHRVRLTAADRAPLPPALLLDRVSHAVHQQPLRSPLGLSCQAPLQGPGNAAGQIVPMQPPTIRSAPMRPMAGHVQDRAADLVVHTEDPAPLQPGGGAAAEPPAQPNA